MDAYKQIEDYVAKKHGAVADKTRKALGDFHLGNVPVNVKSNNVNKSNYSPNIVSARKLLAWVRQPENQLSFIFVDYKLNSSGKITVLKDSGLIPVEHLSWDCLTIEAQGWGVIQMCRELKVNPAQSRASFLKGLKKAYEKYVAKEYKKLAVIETLIKDL